MQYNICDEKLRVIFVYQVPSFWPSWHSLYMECIEDESIETKIFRIDSSYGDKAQMDGSEDFLIKRGYDYEDFEYEKVIKFNPHYMIYQTPYDKGHRHMSFWTARFRRKGIRIVYIPYGIEISDTIESRYKHFSMAVVRNSFSIFVLSEDIRKEYQKYCINYDAVKALGLPRFDSLTDRLDIPDAYKNRINGRKIILWKVHFPKVFVENGIKKQATPKLEEYIRFVEYIKEHNNLFFVFMPHPKFADKTIDSELLPMAQTLIDNLNELENVYIDCSEDYRYSLLNADAILVDRSAIMVEAGINNVPVMYLYNSEYNEPMVKPISDLLDSYYHGTTSKDMESFCDMILCGKDDMAPTRLAAFSKCVPYADGECAKRIKNIMFQEAKIPSDIGMAEEISNCAKIVIFGAGSYGRYVLSNTSKLEKVVKIIGFADNDRCNWGRQFYGHTIISPDDLKTINYDYVVIATDVYFTSIYIQLIEMGIVRDKILSYDQYIVMMNYE